MSAQTEAQKYGAFARRILRAMGRRVSDRDIEALSVLADLQAEVAAQMQASVDGLLASGYSWADIGRQLGISRQGAQQKYGRKRAA
jgi:CRP-like cAMP-binding protein